MLDNTSQNLYFSLTKSDTNVSLFRNGTALKTYTTGDSAQFSFNGTGVWWSIRIYGSKSWNHGDYQVVVDGANSSGSGLPDSGQDEFQQLLWGSGDLASGPHQLTLTNMGFSDGTAGYLDIDYIVWEGHLPDGSSVKRFTTDNPAFEYLPSFSSWAWAPDKNGYSSSQYYTDSTSGEFKFKFTGASVSLAGFLEKNHGNFSCAVDGISYGVASGYYNHMVYQQTLCFIDGLANGEHTLTVKNIPISSYEPWLAIDFVEVGGTHVAAILNSSGGLHTSTEIGIVAGVIGVLIIISLLIFVYLRHKNKQEWYGSYERRTIRHRNLDIEPPSPNDLVASQITPYPAAMSAFPDEETGYTGPTQRATYHRRGDSDGIRPSDSASQAGPSPRDTHYSYTSSTAAPLLPKDTNSPCSDITSTSLANHYRTSIPGPGARLMLRVSNPEYNHEDGVEGADSRGLVNDPLSPVNWPILEAQAKHSNSSTGV
ncbi:hypothetical protein DL93DRAFT_2194440 [Clavulina sp. PMI_390]|nr:hypothetical protein DL93DRAFT_2194440 [Clavulina sp. PMI_390]